MRVGFSPSISSKRASTSGLATARIDPLDIAPADDAVIGLDLEEDGRVDPGGPQPGDANGRRAIRDLGGLVAFLGDDLRQQVIAGFEGIGRCGCFKSHSCIPPTKVMIWSMVSNMCSFIPGKVIYSRWRYKSLVLIFDKSL